MADLTTGAALGEESVAIARELDDQQELATALLFRGIVCVFPPRPGTDDFARGRAYLEEAQALYEEANDESCQGWTRIAVTHSWRGAAFLAAGDLRNAETQLTRCLELTASTGDRHATAVALEVLGRLAWARGDPAGGRAHFEHALKCHEALRSRYGIGSLLTRLGDVLQRTGDPSAARAHYARALRTLHGIGHAETSHQALCGLAGLAMEAGEPVRALRLVSIAGALSALTGVLPSPPVRSSIEQFEAAARQALRPEAQAVAWAAGQAMTMEEVIADANRAHTP
jgi:tetratricopeptide (TPR) repeat protein